MNEYLPNTPRDWVQFAVIFGVIYAVLRVMRGTMAASILRGALVIIAVALVMTAFVLEKFELLVLKSVLSQLLSLVLFALIVVFQAELRRGLLSLGEHKIFDRFRARTESAVDPLSRAVANLARERHGALFAIERRVPLNHIADSGERIDAVTRAELLVNIFWPSAPLHDGGVVLRGDRIVAAACLFPLAQRQDLATSMGTRHRAAIGLSEETDAVIVVVSEETGRVSVVVNGNLTVVDPPRDLGRVLLELLAQEPAPRPAPEPEEEEAADEDEEAESSDDESDDDDDAQQAEAAA